MKAKTFAIISFIAVLALTLSRPATAQGPQPPAPPYPTREPGLPPGAQPWEPEFGKPFIGPKGPAMGIQGVRATSIPIGQPGLSFRYVQTFGTTKQAYISDTQHLNFPLGLFIDGNDNLYITEGHGARLLKFRTSDKALLLTIGVAGLRLGERGTLVEPRDVAVDPAGNIWIADGNVVYQYDSTGNYLNQIGAEIGSGNYQFNYVGGVAFDSTGRLYVSDTDNHRIQVYTFDPNGKPVYFATIGETGVPGSDNNHFWWPAKIAMDSFDRLYIADDGNFRIQRCTYAGGTSWTCSRFHGTGSEGSGADQLGWAWGLGVDRNNNVYIADSTNNRVKKCDPNGNCSIFATNLNFPTDVAVDSTGKVYICSAFAFTVLQYSSTGNLLQTFAGTHGVPYVTDDRYFNAPSGIAVDASGNIYFTEQYGYRLIKLNAAGGVQWQIGTPGVWGRDNAHFGTWKGGPVGLAVGPTGRIYVADPMNFRIQIYDANGNYVATLGGSLGTGNYEFFLPFGVALDSEGNLYVADTWNHRVQVYDSNLVYKRTLGVTRVAGSDNAHFNYPYSVAVDRNGNIYVADTLNFRVQVFNSQGIYSRTLGVAGEQGEDFFHFGYPLDVAVDSIGRVYVKDVNRIQVFDPNGLYLTTIGGSWGTASGQFTGPTSVEVDSAGNVYVTDTYNHRIQKFAPGVPGWKQVNINGFGDPANRINSLGVFGGYLYAGTFGGNGAQLWRASDGLNWTPVITNGFGITRNVGIDHLIEFNGQLYAGTWADSVNGGEVWRSSTGNPGDWTRVVTQGFGDPTNGEVMRLAVFNNQIYAATWSYTSTHGAEIWRSSTGNAGDWTRVVTNGLGDANNISGLTMEVFNGALYAGTYSNIGPGLDGADVWRSTDGSTWTAVITNGFGYTGTYAVSSLAAFGDYLYAGTGRYDLATRSYPGGQIWRCSVASGCDEPGDWSVVITDGFGGAAWNVSSLVVFAGRLYAVGYHPDGLGVWRTADGTHWEQVGFAGFGDSNNTSTYWDNATAVFNNRLYIGTTNSANGGEVWLFLHKRVYLPLVLRNYR
jgi:hypothetical protein